MTKYIFLVTFRNGETRTVTADETTKDLAEELVWQKLPGVDQDRNPRITLVSSGDAQ